MATKSGSAGMDAHEFPAGMTILNDPKEPVVDIVFVHGLQGHPHKTWTYAAGSQRASPSPNRSLKSEFKGFFKRNDEKSARSASKGKDVFWPRDLLKDDFPRARIMTYGYDSNVTKGVLPMNQGNIFTHAENLLHTLEEKRRDASERDLIFIAHSLGGILVKEALRRSETDTDVALQTVYAATIAIFFFGTPHRGSKNWAEYGSELASIVRRLLIDTNDQNIKSLLPSSHELQVCHTSLMQQIDKRGRSLTIRTFQEQQALSGVRFGPANQLIVPSGSSRLDHPHERPCSVNADHMQMVRFSGRNDQTYQAVSADIKQLLETRARQRAAIEAVRDNVSQAIVDKGKAKYPDQGLAKCPQDTIETEDVILPVERRFVKIPCPAHKCDPDRKCDWLCDTCATPLEFGFSDDYIYCSCGRSSYLNWSFRCNKKTHSEDFGQHSDSSALLYMLRSLPPSSWVNILILGETGVGKSTFINALVNYLEFEDLHDALESPELSWLVPSSFSITNVDSSEPDRPIEDINIQIGSRSDEEDGSKGHSATQQTMVYPVTLPSGLGNYGIRLVDTPGIGDTRGVEQDKKNMADILATINAYDELHGILILLKPNNSRLTATFRYCVKELLTHLHQSAAQNIVFGFTNTRTSLYTAGDTFKPLKELLSKNTRINLELTPRITYCFDSESFRYLAAYKKGVPLSHKEAFEDSWIKSREETRRMIDHFRIIEPHQTKSTMSLNGARDIIAKLTKPLAEISQDINANVAVCEDKKKAMEQKRYAGNELRKELYIQRIQKRSQNLQHPRTVCTNSTCTETRDDGTNRNHKVIIYKTHCHEVCSLTNVPIQVVAPKELLQCQAFGFGATETCQHCGHPWKDHMHTSFEFVDEVVKAIDPEIQKQLDANASDVQLRQTHIVTQAKKIKEYKGERDTIRNATAKFGLFLKTHAIEEYNDATAAYLEFLIRVEKNKVRAKGSNERLLSLEEDLRIHTEKVAALESSMKLGTETVDMTESEIDRTVKELFALKHFGQNLKKLYEDTSFAHKSTNREIPRKIKQNPKSSTGSTGKGKDGKAKPADSQQKKLFGLWNSG